MVESVLPWVTAYYTVKKYCGAGVLITFSDISSSHCFAICYSFDLLWMFVGIISELILVLLHCLFSLNLNSTYFFATCIKYLSPLIIIKLVLIIYYSFVLGMFVEMISPRLIYF